MKQTPFPITDVYLCKNNEGFFLLEEIKRAFDVFDKNEDGKLSSTELGEVLACAGLKLSPAELTTFMEKVDTNSKT